MVDYLDELFEPLPAILAASDLAKLLGVNTKTVYEYLQNGDVPAYRVGTKWLIIRDEVKASVRSSSNRSDPLN